MARVEARFGAIEDRIATMDERFSTDIRQQFRGVSDCLAQLAA